MRERLPACLYKLCCVSGYHGSALYVLFPFLPLFFPPPPPQQATLDVVMNLQFHYIEKLWQTFWYSTAPSSDGNTAINNRSAFAATFATFYRGKIGVSIKV